MGKTTTTRDTKKNSWSVSINIQEGTPTSRTEIAKRITENILEKKMFEGVYWRIIGEISGKFSIHTYF